MAYLAREVATSVRILGNCFVRQVPDSAKGITAKTARKFVKTDPKSLPELKQPDTPEACTIPLTKSPLQVPFPALHYAKLQFMKSPSFHIVCSEPVYMALAGLATESWRLTAEVSRTSIIIDGNLDMESQTHSSTRAFLTNRFDHRYPHTLQLSTHNLGGMQIVVGSVYDFQFNNRSCVLDSGHEIDRRKIQLKTLFNNFQSLVYAPILETETGEFVLRSCDLYDVEIPRVLRECESFLHRLQSNLHQIRELGDGNYEIHGEGENMVGVVNTDEVINKQLPFKEYRRELRWMPHYRKWDMEVGPYDKTESEGALGPQLMNPDGEYQYQVLGWDKMKHVPQPQEQYDTWTSNRVPLWCEVARPNGGYFTMSNK